MDTSTNVASAVQSDMNECLPESSQTSQVIFYLNKALGLLDFKDCIFDYEIEAKNKIKESIQLLQNASIDESHVVPTAKEYRSVEVQTRETMVKLHINEMPNECLTLIFKQFPLQQMICLRAICSRWQGVIEAYCEQVHSLKLFKGLGDCKAYCKKIFRAKLDCLRVKRSEDLAIKLRHFGQPLLEFVTSLFPNVEQLTFSCVTRAESEQLVYLLQQWPNIYSLALHGDVNFDESVCEVFQKLTALRRLYLLIDIARPIPISVMSQLDLLTLCANQYGAGFDHSLAHLKPTCTVQLDATIQLFNLAQNLIADSNNPFAHTVTHLRADRIQDEEQQFGLVSRRMLNLQYLNFGGQVFDNLSRLLESICNLKQLTELRVDGQNINFNWSAIAHLKNTTYLPSLKRLFLAHIFYCSLGNGFNSAVWCKTIATVFPNLEELTLLTRNDRKRNEIRDNLKVMPNLKYGNIM